MIEMAEIAPERWTARCNGAPFFQNDQLMSERRILCFKSAPRLGWRGQDGQDEAEQCKHCALTLGDSFSRSNADGVFGTHRVYAKFSPEFLRTGAAAIGARFGKNTVDKSSPNQPA